jgi:hypothetical protein
LDPVIKNEDFVPYISMPEPVIIQDEMELVTATEEVELNTNTSPEAISENLKEADLTTPASESEAITTIESINNTEAIEQAAATEESESVPTIAAYEHAADEMVVPIAEIPDTQEMNSSINKEEPLVFEPLFASDYFASQGIKLREDAQPTDKLGKQLKSFTDWLKTMKKVHENKLPSGNEELDISVQVMAEKSNKEEDVLTETMAEVYLQQGKRNKAKEIYEKLSLLNPSKSAYFAAKIEQIQ